MDLSIGHYERWPQCPDLVHFIVTAHSATTNWVGKLYYKLLFRPFSCASHGDMWWRCHTCPSPRSCRPQPLPLLPPWFLRETWSSTSADTSIWSSNTILLADIGQVLIYLHIPLSVWTWAGMFRAAEATGSCCRETWPGRAECFYYCSGIFSGEVGSAACHSAVDILSHPEGR